MHDKQVLSPTLRNSLSLEDRVRLIRYFDFHPEVSQSRLAELFLINQSSVSRILKDRDRILNQYLKHDSTSSEHCLNTVGHNEINMNVDLENEELSSYAEKPTSEFSGHFLLDKEECKDQEKLITFLEVQKSLITLKTYMKQNGFTNFESYNLVKNSISMSFKLKFKQVNLF